jgi:hypothetical protein
LFVANSDRQGGQAGAFLRTPQGKQGSKMSRTANDDRSDSMNPNNDAYDHAQDNYSDQLNPNNERYQGDDSEEK